MYKRQILKCKALCYESSNNIITLPEGKLAVVQKLDGYIAVSYTHLRAHETVLDLVCRLLLEKKKT